MNINSNDSKTRFVVIDDDPTYRSFMHNCALKEGIDIDSYESLEELGSVGLLGKYDVAIIDYDLGTLNGVEIGEYLSALFKDIPMILVSENERQPGEKGWPQSIRAFIKKSQGYSYVLSEAKRHARRVINYRHC